MPHSAAGALTGLLVPALSLTCWRGLPLSGSQFPHLYNEGIIALDVTNWQLRGQILKGLPTYFAGGIAECFFSLNKPCVLEHFSIYK